MLRSTFFSAGLFVALWGVSFLFVDKVHLTMKEGNSPESERGFRGFFSRMTTTDKQKQRMIDPPDWAAFSLMSVGAVTMLYAVALPKNRDKA
ncbi:MAG: hypothetical protein IID45_09985 [Planctomycetes bacterium]|nr:hypothetical protein [Planctomycetota bacterium]